MPSRHRAAGSSRVMVRPANLTWPEPGDRSPEMRPNRLVLPAPFGPTIPTVSPAPTVNDRSSAMTTRPNRFVTWSSSSNELVIRSGEGGFEVAGDFGVREEGVVDDFGFEGVGGAFLPLDADRRGDDDAGGGVLGAGEVDGAGHRVGDGHLVQGGGDLGLVVRVVDRGERGVRDLEEGVVGDV